jgi:hypothetical protein
MLQGAGSLPTGCDRIMGTTTYLMISTQKHSRYAKFNGRRLNLAPESRHLQVHAIVAHGAARSSSFVGNSSQR